MTGSSKPTVSDGASGAVFCIDIGGSFMKFAVSPAPGAIEPLERIATPADDWESFADAIAALLDRHRAFAPIAAPLALSIA